uniref:Metaxin n=1 Tax=Callorhinchus milii TaxID=7868 RepID=V9KWE6_CALMI|eukprot:gi/632991933/ref/XP_007884847.1/ PREDICTED: metaxin-1-like [Callorhinchus milii]
MASPMELFIWRGDWGLPSVHTDSLTALAYARFAGAPLKVHKLSNPWRSPSGTLPALKTEQGLCLQPLQMLEYFKKQGYNADYRLSVKESADTLAFISLINEKLLPALIYTFWVDAKNYVSLTRPWFANTIPFPLSLYLPNRLHERHLEQLQLRLGSQALNSEEETEAQILDEASECLTLLSQRLASQSFFFGDSPSSLDAVVFGHLAPLLKAKLPNSKLQQHLQLLDNLCGFCNTVLSLYFPTEHTDTVSDTRRSAAPCETDEDPHKRRNQVLSVLVGLVAMLGYAFLSGILSIKRVSARGALPAANRLTEEGDEEE